MFDCRMAHSPCTFLTMDSSDGISFAQPRRAHSGCRVCNEERMSDLLLVPGPVKG
jgi:hypothetical protein